MGRNSFYRQGPAYDPRTGFKVKGSSLRPDGEVEGLFTTDVDEPHPQRYPVVPGPDGTQWRPGIAAPHADGAVIIVWDDGMWTAEHQAVRYDVEWTTE